MFYADTTGKAISFKIFSNHFAMLVFVYKKQKHKMKKINGLCVVVFYFVNNN